MNLKNDGTAFCGFYIKYGIIYLNQHKFYPNTNSMDKLSAFLTEAANEIGGELQWHGDLILPSEAFSPEGFLPVFLRKNKEIAQFCLEADCFESSPEIVSVPSHKGLFGVTVMPMDERSFSWLNSVIAFYILSDAAKRSPQGVIELSHVCDPINPAEIVENHVTQEARKEVHPATTTRPGGHREYDSDRHDEEADEI